jgi:hypothetical protein
MTIEHLKLTEFFGERHLREQGIDSVFDVTGRTGKGEQRERERETESQQQTTQHG